MAKQRKKTPPKRKTSTASLGKKPAKKLAARKKPAAKPIIPRKGSTPPFEEWPEWSSSKFYSFLRSGLRAKWQRFPSRYAVLAAAKREYHGTNPRQKFEFHCAVCKKWHPQKEIEVDHITPVGSLRCWEDLESFCKRLFVGVDKLRAVCKHCHAAITAKWRQEQKQC